jgi:hypothetical protein
VWKNNVALSVSDLVGKISWYVDGKTESAQTAYSLGGPGGIDGVSLKIDANGEMTLLQPPGQHTITAVYTGDPSNPSASITVTTLPSPTPTPSVVISGPTTLRAGQDGTWTVTVVVNGVAIPQSQLSNQIDWFIDGQAAGGTWGAGTLTTSITGVGGHTLNAEYLGDPSLPNNSITVTIVAS